MKMHCDKKKLQIIRRLAAMLLLAAALLYGIRAVIRPVPGEVERICQLFRAGERCLLLTAAAVILLRPGMKPENMFLLLGGVLGSCYLLMLLPGTAPDEEYHYTCILGLASRLLHGSPTVDSSLLNMAGMASKTNTPEGLLAMLQGLSGETLSGQLTAFVPDVTSYPLQYIPQITGTSIALLAGLNRWQLFLLAKLCNLLFYLVVTWQAIRIMPKGKGVLLLIALLPMPLQQAGSISPDGFINAMSFLMIALTFRAAESRERLTLREGIGLAVVGLLLAPAKGIYTMLLLLTGIIPSARFGSRRKKAFAISVLMIAAMALLFVFELTWMLGLEAQGQEIGVEYYTLTWCATHPFDTLRVILHSALYPSVGSYGSSGLLWWLETGAGLLLNTFTLMMPQPVIWGMLLLIVMAALLPTDKQDESLHKGQRLWMLYSILLVFASAFGIMMISWTPFGAELIEGVQGRYFVPVFPLLFLLLRTKKLHLRIDLTRLWTLAMIALHFFCLEEIVDIFLARMI